MCPIAPLGLHISDLGQGQDLSVREKSFSDYRSRLWPDIHLDDLDYLEFKDSSSLIPLDSLSLRFLLGFPFLTFRTSSSARFLLSMAAFLVLSARSQKSVFPTLIVP